MERRSLQHFRDALCGNSILLFDGGMGTLLQSSGLAPGQSPESFGMHNREVIRKIHIRYREAGAQIITTNTFGGTALKLDSGTDVVAFNRAMACVAREAVGDRAWVAGSVGPTGAMVRPLGTMDLESLIRLFQDQIQGLVEGGVDLILAETHFELAEVKAVVLAARKVCDLPVAVSMTFEDGISLTGTSAAVFADTMQNLGVNLIGTNCSAGPGQMYEVVDALLSRSKIPVFVQPNAGLPELENGLTVFRLGPDSFADELKRFVDAGVKGLGGCCGTTFEHIKALKGMVRDRIWNRPAPEGLPNLVLTSRSISVPFGPMAPTVMIGERINPTGKKELTKELQNGELGAALQLGREQVDAGAKVLDVNVGAPMADEAALMSGLALELTARLTVPLCFDSNDPAALQAGLLQYPGSALINSISGEEGKMAALGPVCRDHGAPFILLPLQGKKLPVSARERLTIIESLLAEADSLGIPRQLILVDALALTVSSKPEAAKTVLEVIRHCRRAWDLPTVIGLSNISFGLPARELINATFLAMAVQAGLTACIANPNSARLREALAAGEVLLNRDPQAERFIAVFKGWQPDASGVQSVAGEGVSAEQVLSIRDAVILGRKETILAMLDRELEGGVSAFDLVDGELIPGITDVGERYERKEYFLPQLLLSAETMQMAFEKLRPLLEKGSRPSGGTVVMATVEGDIHDIGKNIVCLMLRNYGFTVVDLGKDVSAERILQAVVEHKADLVGLSALMTTTMTKMKEVVFLLKERGIPAKVMVGGAVLTQEYADRIGADGYAADAVSAVKLAKTLSQSPAEQRE
ncbi:MAG: homocysteine S-methyltransferase family protein [Desulfovibrionales bacterium]